MSNDAVNLNLCSWNEWEKRAIDQSQSLKNEGEWKWTTINILNSYLLKSPTGNKSWSFFNLNSWNVACYLSSLRSEFLVWDFYMKTTTIGNQLEQPRRLTKCSENRRTFENHLHFRRYNQLIGIFYIYFGLSIIKRCSE